MNSLKILHVSYSDDSGGAAKAAHRLHIALRAAGVDSRMLVMDKTKSSPYVYGPASKCQKALALIAPMLNGLPARYLYGYSGSHPFSVQRLPNPLARLPADFSPDIVHLHWVCHGFVPIRALGAMNHSIVWTLHDMWPFTGGCHLDKGCGRYKTGCGACPLLRSKNPRDLSSRIFRWKQEAWADAEITVVTLSQWMERSASESALFGRRPIVRIPNPLNLATYKPVDRDIARDILNLPRDRKLVLFGAQSAIDDENKGGRFLGEALELIAADDPSNIELVIFGAETPEDPPEHGLPVHYVGQLQDDTTLALYYSAADVFVAPSRQDNLPNTIMEALACGTPCVAFDIGGMPDLVSHQRTGYLATPFAIPDLARGIRWCLEHNPDNALGQAGRKYVEEHFADGMIARQYIRLYDEIAGSRPMGSVGSEV